MANELNKKVQILTFISISHCRIKNATILKSCLNIFTVYLLSLIILIDYQLLEYLKAYINFEYKFLTPDSERK